MNGGEHAVPPPAPGPSGPGEQERSHPHDPIAAQRARYDRLARQARRVGYGLFGLSAAVLVAGLVAGLTDVVTVLVVGCLVVGSLLLAPAIVVGYGVKAAEREDRESGR